MNKQLIQDFVKSVTDLADKLPQWNSEIRTRRVYAATLSMLEETGEIAGCMSKFRTRKKGDVDYYYTPPKSLPNYEEVREKLLGECCDLLWILVCSEYSLYKTTDVCSKIVQYKEKETSSHCMESLLLQLASCISQLSLSLIAYEDAIVDSEHQKGILCKICYLFAQLIDKLEREYDITLENVMLYNMEKLGKRYDKNGKRTDGK